jgi:hypothetical protein
MAETPHPGWGLSPWNRSKRRTISFAFMALKIEELYPNSKGGKFLVQESCHGSNQ